MALVPYAYLSAREIIGISPLEVSNYEQTPIETFSKL